MVKEQNENEYNDVFESLDYTNTINNLTIQYLTSNKQKNKIFSQKNIINKKDKKFYRRRILNLTRDMLLNNQPDDLLTDVKDTFDVFVKNCIGYFKSKDRTEILQEDYKMEEMLDEICCNESEEDILTQEQADKLMMRSIQIQERPLDKFVKIKYLKKEEDIILPKQKEINLKDPELKKKGILRKKNISKTYKNETKNEEEHSTDETK